MDTVTYDGRSYDVYKSGSYIAFVDKANVTSGTLNLLSFFQYVIDKGWIPGDLDARRDRLRRRARLHRRHGRDVRGQRLLARHEFRMRLLQGSARNAFATDRDQIRQVPSDSTIRAHRLTHRPETRSIRYRFSPRKRRGFRCTFHGRDRHSSGERPMLRGAPPPSPGHSVHATTASGSRPRTLPHPPRAAHRHRRLGRFRRVLSVYSTSEPVASNLPTSGSPTMCN